MVKEDTCRGTQGERHRGGDSGRDRQTNGVTEAGQRVRWTNGSTRLNVGAIKE